MRYLHILLVLFLFGCKSSAPKPQVHENAEVKKIINEFFTEYQSGSVDDAIDYLFNTNNSFLPEQTQELKNMLASASITIGAFTGFEEITEKSTSPSLTFFSYLVKHDRQPLRFNFMFYKPRDKWILYKFKFDDNVATELEEAGRIYFVK